MSKNKTSMQREGRRPEIQENNIEKFFNRDYLLLYQGQFVSRLGNVIYSIAIAIWIKEITGSGTIMGLFYASTGLPLILMSAFGGAVADRFSRKKIIVGADAIIGVAMLLLAGLLYYNAGSPSLLVGAVFGVGIMASAIRAFFGPAISAAIPDIVPTRNISTANSMSNLSDKVSQLVGNFFGPVLFNIIGLPLTVLVNAITYLFSAFSESFISIPQRIPEKAKGYKEYATAFKKDLKEGLNFIRTSPGLYKLLMLSIITGFFVAPITPLIIFYVTEFLKLGNQWFGYFLIAFGVGALVGAFIVGIFNIDGKARMRSVIFFFILEGTGYVLLPQVTHPLQALALFFIGGIMNGYNTVSIFTIMQVTTPTEIRGRVFGTLTTLSGAIVPLGMALGGVLYDFFKQDITPIYTISGSVMILTVIIFSFSYNFRQFMSYQVRPQRAVKTGFTYKMEVKHKDEILSQRERHLEEQLKKTRSDI